MINEPAVLLLDEPLGALDLRLRIEVQEELRRLQRKLGSPFIFVTHDQGEAMALADRIVVMKDGRIEQDGPPTTIYQRPRTLFVANFVGYSNVMQGLVERVEGDGVTVAALGRKFACAAPQPLQAGARVAIVIRHEAVRLQAHSASAAGLAGTIADVAFLGATVRHWIRLADGSELQAEGPVAAAGSLATLTPGTAVQVNWPAGAATAYPAE